MRRCCNMDEKLDAKIKQILQENDDIVVPKKDI